MLGMSYEYIYTNAILGVCINKTNPRSTKKKLGIHDN